MRQRVEQFLNLLLTISAVAVAASLVHREFLGTAANARELQPPKYFGGWSGLVDSAAIIGQRNAPVTILEFMDLECPFCRSFHEATKLARQKYGAKLSIAVLDLPLQGHRFARPAARALHCAGAAGQYGEFLDAVYTYQDSLGLRPWQWFAGLARVSDTVTFNRCVALSDEVAPIESGLRLAKRLGVAGTPTVLVNGWQFALPPDFKELDRTIAGLLAGQNPRAH